MVLPVKFAGMVNSVRYHQGTANGLSIHFQIVLFFVALKFLADQVAQVNPIVGVGNYVVVRQGRNDGAGHDRAMPIGDLRLRIRQCFSRSETRAEV